MKFQSIFIFYIIFNIGYVDSGPLTDAENAARVNDCGMEPLDRPSNGKPLKSDRNLIFGVGIHPISVTGSLISPRHILTLAHPVLKEGIVWTDDSGAIEESTCNQTGYVEVPENLVKELKLTNGVSAIKAFIFCDSETHNVTKRVGFPMVVEIDKNFEVDCLCIEDEKTYAGKEKVLDFYSVTSNFHVMYTELKVDHAEHDHFFRTKGFKNSDFLGGPMIKLDEESDEDKYLTIVGISIIKDKHGLWFFKLRWFEKALCDLTGICGKGLKSNGWKETTVPPTTEQPTTEEPTTVPRTTEQLTTEEPTTVPSTSEDPTTSESSESSAPSESSEPTTSESSESLESLNLTTSEPSESSESSESSNSTSEPSMTSPRPHATFSPPPSTEDAEESEKPEEFHWKHSDIDEEFGDFLERNEGWNDETEENNDIFLSDDFLINSGNLDSMGMELFVLGCLVLIKI